jgi:hypothetical protein
MWPQITPSTPRSRAWRRSESSKLKTKLTAAFTLRLAKPASDQYPGTRSRRRTQESQTLSRTIMS